VKKKRSLIGFYVFTGVVLCEGTTVEEGSTCHLRESGAAE